MNWSRRWLLASPFLAAVGQAHAEDTTRAWSFRFPSIEESGTLDLATYRERVLLVVNTASFCGFTYQYEALEDLHASLSPRGLTVIGVPSQDFHQEKSSNAAVKEFCESSFDVQFPMTGLSHVRGPDAHPFYRWVQETKSWQPRWNFHKVLIARDGTIAGLFGSSDEPGSEAVKGGIERLLGA